MAKRFNITGTCIPERHYLGDISKKLDRIIEIVIQGDYFTINRPRQYGKTTILYLLQKRLGKNKDYLTIDASVYETHHRQGISQLCDYLDRQNETTGYLLIYDLRKELGRSIRH